MNIYHYYAELITDNGEVCQRASGHVNAKEVISNPDLYEQVASGIEAECRGHYPGNTNHLRFNLISLSRLN